MRNLSIHEINAVAGGNKVKEMVGNHTMQNIMDRSIYIGGSLGALAGMTAGLGLFKTATGGLIGGFYGLFSGGLAGLMVGFPLAGFYGTDNVPVVEVIEVNK